LDEHGELVGIVSEADLIHRVETGTDQHHSWWHNILSGRRALEREFLKSHGVKSVDVMTKPVIVASPEIPLGELVNLFDKHRIKRVPVVEQKKIVGIVSRANVLQALLQAFAVSHETIAAY
jgi:CBS-domain-containing membrane protein